MEPLPWIMGHSLFVPDHSPPGKLELGTSVFTKRNYQIFRVGMSLSTSIQIHQRQVIIYNLYPITSGHLSATSRENIYVSVREDVFVINVENA